MNPPAPPEAPILIGGSRRTGGISACIPVGVGALGLLGWVWDNRYLTSLHPSLVPINPLTATWLILSGSALLALYRSPANLKPAVRAAAALIVLVGLLRLLGYFTPWNFPLDRILFRDKLAAVPFGPNHMAPNTAFDFMLFGGALGLAPSRDERLRYGSQLLGLLLACLSFLGLLGYLFHFVSLYRVSDQIPMAVTTVLGFLFAALGMLCFHPHSGPVSLLFSATTGGYTARRLLPVAIFAPTLAAWIFVEAQASGRFDAATGMARLTLANILIASLAVFLASRRLHQGDLKRSHAEDEIRRLNASLRGQAERLEAANKGLESFSYSVSHDLRSPLSHMQGYAEMLARETEGKLEGKSARYLQVIQDEAMRMGSLIDNLLEFAKTERAEMRVRTVDMQILAAECIRRLEPETRGRNVAWNLGSLPSAAADPSLLEQALINLLSNALKYSGKRPESRIEIGFRPEADGGGAFYVRDNGVGFDMRYADKLFGVFQRLHSAKDYAGTGIGLANVRSIVQRHGGKVWAESEPDKGAVFFFSLPLREPG